MGGAILKNEENGIGSDAEENEIMIPNSFNNDSDSSNENPHPDGEESLGAGNCFRSLNYLPRKLNALDVDFGSDCDDGNDGKNDHDPLFEPVKKGS